MPAPEGNDYATGNPGGRPPEGNQNARTHGLYSDVELLYEDLSEPQQEHVDALIEAFEDRLADRGADVGYDTRTRLFRIAVSHMKETLADNYLVRRSHEDDTDNPLVAREIVGSSDSGPIFDEVPTSMSKELSRISRDNRQWMKEMGLLPQSPDDVDAHHGISPEKVKEAFFNNTVWANGGEPDSTLGIPTDEDGEPRDIDEYRKEKHERRDRRQTDDE